METKYSIFEKSSN